MIVRCKISQGVVFIAAGAASLRNLACYLVISARIKARAACYGVEESKQSDRMLPTFVLELMSVCADSRCVIRL
jgi:hypothetical protein